MANGGAGKGSVRAWVGEAAASLALTVVGTGFALAARRMPMWEDGVPGPGLAPVMLGIALAAFGIGIAAAAIARRSEAIIEVVDRDSSSAVALMLVAVLAFDAAGYLVSTFLFLLSCFVLIGREPWLRASLVALTATLVTWALFVKALGVQLPAGLLTWMR